MTMPRRRRWVITTAALATGALAVWLFIELPRLFVGNDAPKSADVLIILAGGRYTTPRLQEGRRLVADGYAETVLVSGIEFDPNSPAFLPDSLAELQHFPAGARVIIDSGSRTTHLTAQWVAQRAAAENWNRLLIVTSDFHWRRARRLFRYELGPTRELRLVTIPTGDFSRWWADPQLRKLTLNECRYMIGFVLFGSTYGIWILGGVVVAVIAKRKWRKRGRKKKTTP